MVANGFPVRILINAVAARMGGAATHLPNFLRTAGRRAPQDTFLACVNSQWRLPDLPDNVTLIDAGDVRGRLSHAAWDQWRVARLAVHERADVLISLLNFGPVLCPTPHVVLERNPVYFCDFYLRTLRRAQALEVAATRALAYAVMRASHRVITPSAAMRDMIRTFYPDLPLEKFRVVPHGFALEEFRSDAPLPADLSRRLADAQGSPRLLYVSHAASYKGIDVLLEAVRFLRNQAIHCTTWLTIAQEDWPAGVTRYQAFIKQHGLGDRVHLLGRIPHDVVHHVYRAADLFVYPSLCESFGFPMVEAMASGLPIIASDRPVNREICRDAAVYYPPRDPILLCREIIALLGAESRRRRLAEAGTRRAAQFSWDAHVDGILEVAREAAAAKR